jgi:hypothetical protein
MPLSGKVRASRHEAEPRAVIRASMMSWGGTEARGADAARRSVVSGGAVPGLGVKVPQGWDSTISAMGARHRKRSCVFAMDPRGSPCSSNVVASGGGRRKSQAQMTSATNAASERVQLGARCWRLLIAR